MPDDKYNGLYIHKELVKGSWYGICSGPKPQVFTGNIDDDPESLRNKSIVVASPSDANGHFPTSAYGHQCAVLTTRYGDGVYLQNLFDTQANIEYDRVCINYVNRNSWREWQRVTTWGDASSTANEADQRSRNNSTAINQIDSAIGGRTANPNINKRVLSNASAIDSINTTLSAVRTTANNAANNAAKALDHSNKLVNGDVRSGQLAGIKVYTNQNGFSINPGDTSVRVLGESNMSSWGFNGSNSVFLVSNANGDLNGAHVEGGTFIPPISGQNRGGWYAVFNGSNNTDILLNWTLIVFNQSIS